MVVGTEVPAAGKLRTVLVEFLRQSEIAAQRFENMLPGPGGVGIADAKGFPGGEGANDVNDEAVVAQSPPPMTLPARAEAIATLCCAYFAGGKKESR